MTERGGVMRKAGESESESGGKDTAGSKGEGK